MPASIVLALALIGVSFAGPLVRLSHAHPLAIAIWRLGFALVIIAVALVTTGSWRQWKRLDRAGMLIAVGAGVMLALHFWAWNSSVSMTSVSASVVLVNMQPAMVALLSALWLREPPTREQWMGIGIACSWGRASSRCPTSATGRRTPAERCSAMRSRFWRDLTAAFYFVAGRRLRVTLDSGRTSALVYGTCFVTLLVFAASVHAPVLDSRRESWRFFWRSRSARCCSDTPV